MFIVRSLEDITEVLYVSLNADQSSFVMVESIHVHCAWEMWNLGLVGHKCSIVCGYKFSRVRVSQYFHWIWYNSGVI